MGELINNMAIKISRNTLALFVLILEISQFLERVGINSAYKTRVTFKVPVFI